MEFEKGCKVQAVKTKRIGTLKRYDYVKECYVVDIDGKEINYWLWEIQIREAKNELQKLIFKLKRKL